MTDATLIDGKAFSKKLVERVAERVAGLSAISAGHRRWPSCL